MTHFIKKNVKQENIFIQEEETTINNVKGEDKNNNIDLDNFSSKLAAIIYNDNIFEESLGVEIRKYKKEYAVFSLKMENNNNINSIDGKKKIFK